MKSSITARLESLPTHPAAVNSNNLSRHITTSLTSQKHNHALEILGFTPSTSRDSSHNAGIAVGIVDERNVHVRVNVAGCDGINVDALGDPLVR